MTLYQNCSNRSALLNKMAARAKNRKTFKQLLLLNQKMDFVIIIQECILGDPLPKLLKRFGYVEQNGRQGNKQKQTSNNFFWWNVSYLTVYQNCSNRSALLNKMAVGLSVEKSFKRLLLLNQWTDFEII